MSGEVSEGGRMVFGGEKRLGDEGLTEEVGVDVGEEPTGWDTRFWG